MNRQEAWVEFAKILAPEVVKHYINHPAPQTAGPLAEYLAKNADNMLAEFDKRFPVKEQWTPVTPPCCDCVRDGQRSIIYDACVPHLTICVGCGPATRWARFDIKGRGVQNNDEAVGKEEILMSLSAIGCTTTTPVVRDIVDELFDRIQKHGVKT